MRFRNQSTSNSMRKRATMLPAPAEPPPGGSSTLFGSPHSVPKIVLQGRLNKPICNMRFAGRPTRHGDIACSPPKQ
jgi:hypothetical protein